MLQLFWIFSAIFPVLDTEAHEAAWNHYWKGQLLRRLVAGVLTALVLTSAMPARAQGLPVYDNAGFWQHAEEYIQNGWRFIWTENDSTQKMIRDAGLAYKAYKQSVALYNRIGSMNITANLVNALPILETDSPMGPGQTEVVTIRPVFRPRERLASTFHPTFGLQNFKWNNLDFDVDRSTVSSGNPYSSMTPEQLQTQAVSDGWTSWVLSQQRAGLTGDNLAGPSNGPYSQVESTVENQYLVEMNALEQIVQNTLEAYGEGSIQYQTALANYSSLLTDVSSNAPTTESNALVSALQQQDSDASVQLEKYSVAALSMSLAAQRADALAANNHAIAEKYDSRDLMTKFEDFLGVGPLLQTISALDGDPTNKALSKEPLGNQLKQSGFQQDIASSQQEALKFQMKKEMEDAQQRMVAIAQTKQDILNNYNKRYNDRLTLENQRLAQIQADLQHKALDIQLASAKLPDGTVQVVPDNLVPLVPGAQPASQNPDGGIAKNVSKSAATLGNQTQSDLATALSTIGSGAGLAMLAPLARGVANAWQALTGKTFYLQGLGINNQGASNGHV